MVVGWEWGGRVVGVGWGERVGGVGWDGGGVGVGWEGGGSGVGWWWEWGGGGWSDGRHDCGYLVMIGLVVILWWCLSSCAVVMVCGDGA